MIIPSRQVQDLEKAYADLQKLRSSDGNLPDEFCETLETLDATLAHLHSSIEDMSEKTLEMEEGYTRSRALFDLAPDTFLVTDDWGVIREANASAATLFQRDPLQLVGKPLRNFVAESDSRAFMAHLLEIADKNSSSRWDMVIVARNGTYVTVTCHGVSTIGHGTTPAVIFWMMHDVTERARYEHKLTELNAELEQRVQARTAELARAHAGMRQLADRLVVAQEDERKRLSRELHDEVGQALIALRMSLDALRQELAPEQTELHTRVMEAGELAFRTVEQLRLLAQDLRPPAIDVVELDALLAQFCHETGRRTNLTIDYSSTALPPLEASLKITLYRFLQEALSNIIRHAQATHGEVSLGRDGDWVTLSVSDNGIGFDVSNIFAGANHAGIGLMGMKERIEMLGGKLEIESQPDQGTRIAAAIPLGESPPPE